MGLNKYNDRNAQYIPLLNFLKILSFGFQHKQCSKLRILSLDVNLHQFSAVFSPTHNIPILNEILNDNIDWLFIVRLCKIAKYDTKPLIKVLDAKLLHPGVNTGDILTAYIAAIRALRYSTTEWPRCSVQDHEKYVLYNSSLIKRKHIWKIKSFGEDAGFLRIICSF